MNCQKKIDEIRIWSKELIVEEKSLNYKFKLNGLWSLDPFRWLSEEGNFKNHIFDPHVQQITNYSQSETSNESIETFNIVMRERQIKDILIMDLWGHSMNLVENQLYIIGGVGRNSF